MKKPLLLGAVWSCVLALTATSTCATSVYNYSSDFEAGAPGEFSGITALKPVEGFASYGFSGSYLFNDSGFSPFAPQPTRLILTNLPAHETLELNFLLAVIDSWDGSTQIGGTAYPDFFNIIIDNALVYSETYDNLNLADQSAPTTNLLVFGENLNPSNTNNIRNDSAYDMGQLALLNSVPHTSDSVTIEWVVSGSGWQGLFDESWAIDNVEVALHSSIVPVPPAFYLFGSGLLGLMGIVRQKVF